MIKSRVLLFSFHVELDDTRGSVYYNKRMVNSNQPNGNPNATEDNKIKEQQAKAEAEAKAKAEAEAKAKQEAELAEKKRAEEHQMQSRHRHYMG